MLSRLQGSDNKSRKMVKEEKKMRVIGKNGETILLMLFLIFQIGIFSQTPSPSLPSEVSRFAWFGCDSMTINGSTKVYGVESVGGAQGFGGHLGSDGNITINGSNTLAGNAYYAPGKSVTINGSQSQLQGSKIEMAQALPCGSETLSSWLSYAQNNNLNSQVSTKYLDSNRNFTLNGNKSCVLNSGFYYFNNVTLNGSATFSVNGAVTIVCTGSLTINGNAKANQNGNPENLVFVVSSSSTVALNGNAKMSLIVFAPLSEINVNGNILGYGNLWGKRFIGNGSVVWSRVKDSIAPSIEIIKPQNGSTQSTKTPEIEVVYSDSQFGTNLDLSSLSIKMDGTEIGGSLNVSQSSATGNTPFELSEGSHTLSASISDWEGNTASASSSFNVSMGTSDTTPPVITITGVENGGWYNYDVIPVITIADENLDPSKNVITLNNEPFVSGTSVAIENFYLIFVSAEDTFGNKSQASLYFVIDKTPPVIKITDPSDNAVVGSTPSQLKGRIEDIAPESLTIDGESVSLIEGGEFTVQRALQEGLNAFTFVAKDRAQNTSTLVWHIVLKTTKPTITITSPQGGLVTSAKYVDVEGTVSNDTVKVFVGSEQALLSGTTFHFPRFSLSKEGENIIVAKATDAAGNESQTQVVVERDTIPPKIKIDSPKDGSHFSTDSATVAGTITDIHSFTASLNGETIEVSNNSFSKATSLVSGNNIISISAVDIAGNRSDSSVTVVKDFYSFLVVSTNPLNSESDISPSYPIEVSFNNELDPLTLNSNSFAVSISGSAVSGTLLSFGKSAKFIPSTDYPENSIVSVSLNSNLKDKGGTSLTPYSFSFKTLSSDVPSLMISLDPLPLVTNKSSLSVSGLTSPGAEVTLQSQGGQPVSTTADSSGKFNGEILLLQNQMNVIKALANLSGQSAEDSRAVLNDNIPPYVISCNYDGSKIEIEFSEPVDEMTISEVSVLLSQGEEIIPAELNLGDFGTKLEIFPETAIGSNAVLLTLSNKIKDLAQNELIPFAKSFNGAQGGGASYLLGEVFNDVTGLPLSSVQVEIVSGGEGSAVTTSYGSYSIPSPSGEVILKIGGGSFSEIYRKTEGRSASLTKVFDARLTPLSQDVKSVGNSGGELSFLAGEILLSIPENAFSSDTTLRITKLSGQSLPFLLPQGFSPLACYRIDYSAAPTADITAKIKAKSSTPIPSAYFDENEFEWIGLNPAVSSGEYFNLTLPSSSFLRATCFVLLKPDTAPSPPPEVSYGSVLKGVTPSLFSSPSATLSTEPSVIFPDQKAMATALITPSQAEPSGMPFEARFVETLDLREGGATVTKRYSPYASDVVAYQEEQNPLSHTARFPVSPFPDIDIVTLLEGKISVEVGAFKDEALGGGIVDATGGSVSDSSGSLVEIPPNAVDSPIPVRIIPLSLSSILVQIPQDYEFLSAVDISFGGNVLSSPATIKIPKNALSKAISPSDKIFVVSLDLVSGVYSFILKDFAYLDGDFLRTSSGSQALSSIPNSYFKSVKKEGKYIFLKAKNPLSFSEGKVKVEGNGVKDALVGIVSSMQSERREEVQKLVEKGKAEASALEIIDFNSITYLTDEGGDYLVPFSLGGARIKAVDVSSGDNGFVDVSSSSQGEVLTRDIEITPLPLTVVSTFPENGAMDVSPGIEIVINFSKSVSADSVTSSNIEFRQNGEIVSGNYRVLFGGSSVSFIPSQNFLSGSVVSAVITGVKDKYGRALSSQYSFSFTVRNENKPKIDIGKIEAFVKSNGTMCVKGSIGSVGGGNIVYLENLSHPEYGTVSVEANGDGSFEVCITANPRDGIKLYVISSSGSERSYTFKQFTSEDKKSVYIGADGGSYEFKKEDGTALGSVEVDEGTFDTFTKITLLEGNLADSAETPDGLVSSAPLQLTIDGSPKKGIKVVIPLPSGMGGNEFWLVRSLKWNNPEQISPMFIDKMDVVNYKGKQSLINRCDEFPGVRTSGSYQVYGNSQTERTEDSLENWGFLSGQYVSAGYFSQFVVHILGLTQFVYLIDYEEGLYEYYLPIPPRMAGPYDLTFSDPATGEVVYSETHTEIPEPGSPLDLGISTDIETKPYPIDSVPFRVIPFDIPEY
ncbi:MAG: Ig-like domain-containing protein, partial [Acidobacteriota bacterium]